MSTQKQKLAHSKIVENGGNVSKTMKESGYSPATAKTPSKLTRSKGWQELMEKYLPEKLLARKHRQLLNKKQVVVIGRGINREAFPTKEIDTEAVARGLDMGYKLRGKYKPTQIDVRSFVGWTPKELKDYAERGIVPERFRIES